MPQLLRSGRGFVVRTEGDLERVLHAVAPASPDVSIVNVHLDPLDRSAALERLTRRLGRRAGLGRGSGGGA